MNGSKSGFRKNDYKKSSLGFLIASSVSQLGTPKYLRRVYPAFE
jgi:hypothetical protein